MGAALTTDGAQTPSAAARIRAPSTQTHTHSSGSDLVRGAMRAVCHDRTGVGITRFVRDSWSWTREDRRQSLRDRCLLSACVGSSSGGYPQPELTQITDASRVPSARSRPRCGASSTWRSLAVRRDRERIIPAVESRVTKWPWRASLGGDDLNLLVPGASEHQIRDLGPVRQPLRPPTSSSGAARGPSSGPAPESRCIRDWPQTRCVIREDLGRIGEGTPWSATGNRDEPNLPRDSARATHNRDLTTIGRPRRFPQKWIGAVRLEHDPGVAAICICPDSARLRKASR